MILHFTDGINYLNIFFERGNYNNDHLQDVHYLELSPKDFQRVIMEMDFNKYDYERDLTITPYKKEQDADHRQRLQAVLDRMNAGELLSVNHVIGTNGKRYPEDRQLQRDIIYAAMLFYPDRNNTEIAEMTGASRGTVIKCRKELADQKDVAVQMGKFPN